MPKGSNEPIQISGTMSADGRDTTTMTRVNQPTGSGTTTYAAGYGPAPSKSYGDLVQAQKEADLGKNAGKTAASKEEWQSAWKSQQREHAAANVRKESHSEPTPLLADKISSLPADSHERRHYENLKNTFDGSAANVGSGLDSLTRESYRDVRRLAKHSQMMQDGVKEPPPEKQNLLGTESVLGAEDTKTVVPNIQTWKPAMGNAVQPVSDAMGSHADTASSVNKSPMGADQNLPQAATATVDTISPQIAKEMDASAKANAMESMQHMPAKMSGSIRHLAAAGDKALAIPFELASDVYGGLLKVMDEIANLGDTVMNAITQFAISSVGGLVNGLFPAGALKGLIGPISKFTSQIGGLTQLLGGFSALGSIATAVGGIASSLAAALRDPLKLAAMFKAGADVAGIVGGGAGKGVLCADDLTNVRSLENKLNKIANTAAVVGGALSALGSIGNAAGGIGGNLSVFGNFAKGGLGNLGSILGKGIGGKIASLFAALSHPEQIINGLLPPELAKSLAMLDKLCNTGCVGNHGYSVGNIMDSLRDTAFSNAMKTHAAHGSIIGPLFNKEVKPVGGYAQEACLDQFAASIFVPGAQGNKGITMIGPGGTQNQKVFGTMGAAVAEDTYPSGGGMSEQEIDKQIQRNLTPAQYQSYKQQTSQYQADAAMWRQKAADARKQAATPTTIYG